MTRTSLVVLLGLFVAAAAQAAPRVTRADLAVSYLRFQRAYREHPPSTERRADVNRTFDRASLAFLRGGLAEVAREFDALVGSLRDASPEGRLALSLRVRFEPRVAVAGRTEQAVARIVSLYPVARNGDDPVRLTMRLRAEGEKPWEFSFDLKPGPVDLRVEIPDSVLEAAGTRRVELVTGADEIVDAGRWFIARAPLEDVRADLLARLEKAGVDSPALADAAAVVRDRIGLLREDLDPGRSVVLLTDPLALEMELRDEIAALEEGRDPQRGRPGHLWRRLRIGRLAVPMRQYVPAAVRNGKPLPIVIALHGAGADENVFPEAYGDGRIVRLADEHGFLVVSPATGGFGLSPRSVGVLLDTLELHAAIDRRRVYVVGHSMGAMTAVAIAQRQADRLAAVCAISGGGRIVPGRRMTPTLFLAGEIDPIVPAPRVRSAYESAKAAGYPVEFRLARGYGHTLIVGDRLPEVVAWLLAHRRPAEKAEEPR